MADQGQDVYCTLLMSDNYLPGAVVLAHSLRDCGTTKKIAILVTLDSLLRDTVKTLETLYDYIIPVDRIGTPNIENLARLNRLDLRFAFTKIALWRQQHFRKIVYIDADVVALRAPDELFELPHSFAAAPDVGWPDCFNSGVMLLTPSVGEYNSMQTMAKSGTSFDGADQGLLNEYYHHRPWHRLSFAYNCTPSASYQYGPAYRHFKHSLSLVHFIGKDKPWQHIRPAAAQQSGVYGELLSRWWGVYDRHYTSQDSGVVQQYVAAEAGAKIVGLAVPGQPTLHITTPAMEPATKIAAPFEVPGPGANQAPLAVHERQSVPQMEWDATRSEPPRNSKPEAANFPSEHYEMSRDRELFHPPRSYPAPPKDMNYQVPEIKPQGVSDLKPLFPWETANRRPPARVFRTELPAIGPENVLNDTPPHDDEMSVSMPSTREEVHSPGPESSSSSDPWSSFTVRNAWDEVVSIDQYVRALKQAQTRKGKVQIIQDNSEGTTETARSLVEAVAKRRESLILVDFPTEIERPSLPVTPAPTYRPTFWGEERNEEGDLPAAYGVPDQADWNPIQRLEDLRRSSIAAPTNLPAQPSVQLPSRDMPDTAARLASSPTAVRLPSAFNFEVTSPSPVVSTGPEMFERALWRVAEEDVAPDEMSNFVRDDADLTEIVGTEGRAADAVPAYEDLVKSQRAIEELYGIRTRDTDATATTADDTKTTEPAELKDPADTVMPIKKEQIQSKMKKMQIHDASTSNIEPTNSEPPETDPIEAISDNSDAVNAVPVSGELAGAFPSELEHQHTEKAQPELVKHQNSQKVEQAEPIRVQHVQAQAGEVQLAETQQTEAQAEQIVDAGSIEPISSTPKSIRITSFERAAMEPTFTGMRLSGMNTSGETFNEPMITHAAAVEVNSTEQLKSVETGVRDRSAETLVLGTTTTEYLLAAEGTRQSTAVGGGLQYLETKSTGMSPHDRAFNSGSQGLDGFDGSQPQMSFSTPSSSSRTAATELASAQGTGIEAGSNPATRGTDVYGIDETISTQLARTKSLRRKASFESITSRSSNPSTTHTHSIVSQGISTPVRSTSMRVSGAASDESTHMQSTASSAAASTPTRSSTATPNYTPTHSPHTHVSLPHSQGPSHSHFRSLASVPSKESIVTERTFSGGSFRVPSFSNPHFVETHFTHQSSDTQLVYGQNSFKGVVQEGPAPRIPPRPQ